MPNNFLITGRPGSGKTSVVERAVAALRDQNFEARGLYCPEIREEGVRQGFKMVDVMTGESRVLAHVDQQVGPQVSKYRVNVENVDAMSEIAINRALQGADFLVIDEIAPMEVYSKGFNRSVLKALDSPKPVIAVVHKRSSTGFIGEIKARSDVQLLEVTPENRASLHEHLVDLVIGTLSQEKQL
ncbi:MAG: NTPase [Candidatus Hadarchaeota archaeon]|nr:NTPase [Candidatus Hadarchaeota archaeon]